MPRVPRALRRDAEPLPPRQRALPPQRRPARGGPGLRRCCTPPSPPACCAAELTGGLVDPTLVAQLEANGYDRTRRAPELALARGARRAAPAHDRPRPTRDEPWRQRRAHRRDCVRRPPGLRLDTGGTGKGLAADLLANRLEGRWAVDCGGDLRVGGAHDVEVRHPLTRDSDPHAARRGRRGRHLRHRHAPLARARRHPAPPSARPVHRRTRLDGPDQRHRARAHRARGRGAGQGRAAQRPERRGQMAQAPRRPR